MDLAAEFVIPPSASQVIEWDSGGDEEEIREGESQKENPSPIFRRQQPFLSPVLRSKRSVSSSSQKPDWLPTKRKLEMMMEPTERDIFLKLKTSSFLESKMTSESAPLPSLSSWLAKLSPSSPSSCQVSSCESLAGLAPQPPAEGAVRLTGTTWLAGVEEVNMEVLGDLDSGSEGDEEDALHKSDKKRKPVKNGLVAQLERSLRWEKSRRVLAEYQADQRKVLVGDERKMVVELIKQEGEVVMITGQQGTVVIHKEFCEREPVVGDKISFFTPRVSTVMGGMEVWLGVIGISVVDGGVTGQEQLEHKIGHTVSTHSMLCPCQSRIAAECVRNVAIPFCPSPSVSPMAGFSILSTVSTSPSPTPVKACTVRQVVERLGGCSSSPQQIQGRRERQVLELVVHRVFTRHRRSGMNTTLNTTILGEEEIAISLLCEDQSGDFSVVKLDSELRKEESWDILFQSSWEVVVGSKVIINSPLYVQDRITKGNNHKLFSVMRSIRKTDQRFCYVIKAFPGSNLQLAEVGVVELECMPSLERATRAQGCRVNLKVVVFYMDRELGLLYMQDIPPAADGFMKVTISSSFPLSLHLATPLPVTATVTSLSIDSHGQLLVDSYSAIMSVTSTSFDCYTLPTFSSTCKHGDLVRVEGVILRVDQESSLQWVECRGCQSDQLVQTVQGWTCSQCGPISSPVYMVELVCCVKGVWARLRDSAKKVLPGIGKEEGAFHPGDVIGQVLPGVMCRVGEDLVAVECRL